MAFINKSIWFSRHHCSTGTIGARKSRGDVHKSLGGVQGVQSRKDPTHAFVLTPCSHCFYILFYVPHKTRTSDGLPTLLSSFSCPKMAGSVVYPLWGFNTRDARAGWSFTKRLKSSQSKFTKYISACLQIVFRKLVWKKSGIQVNGEYLSHLRSADDIILNQKNNSKKCFRSCTQKAL